MKTKKSQKMTHCFVVACPIISLLILAIAISPTNAAPTKVVEAEAPEAKPSSLTTSTRSLPKRQLLNPNNNNNAQVQGVPIPLTYTSNNRNYNDQSRDRDVLDSTSRLHNSPFSRGTDGGSDKNNYNGNRLLGGRRDDIPTNGANDQKISSQDSYDPFYFFQPQGRGRERDHVPSSQQHYQHQYPHNNHHSHHHSHRQPMYQRQKGDLVSSSNTNNNNNNNTPTSSSSSPPRNRRNSHNINTNWNNNNYFGAANGEKYDILTSKSAYPLVDNHFANANSHPSTYRSHHYSSHHHNPNQFLSQDELTRPGTNRHFPPSNSLDHYGGNGAYPSRGRGDVPWSVQIGTQLKVNDDGRAPNPTQFYVRDERNGPPHRRHPIYRK